MHARRKFIKATENDFQKEKVAKFTAIMAKKDNETDSMTSEDKLLRRIPYTTKENLHQLLPHKWQKKINPPSSFLPPDYKIQ